MADDRIYGWFDSADQGFVPSYEPPRDAPCLYCGKPVHKDDVRTFSMMFEGGVYAKRSYFYRTHRTCDDANKKRRNSSEGCDEVIWELIKVNGD